MELSLQKSHPSPWRWAWGHGGAGGDSMRLLVQQREGHSLNTGETEAVGRRIEGGAWRSWNQRGTDTGGGEGSVKGGGEVGGDEGPVEALGHSGTAD